MTPSTYSLSARYVFPVEGPPVRGGRVTVQDGRIAAVDGPDAGPADLDLGNVALLPGFVNAHTHLELSPIDGESGGPPEDQIGWLSRVIRQRRAASREDLAATAEAHLRLAIAGGATLLADTATAGLSWPAIAAAPIRGLVFAELIGLKRERGLQTENEAWEWMATVRPEAQVSACARPGLSPHAPFSTAEWLYHRAAASGLPLSTHLAEMPEELELLRDRSGRLRDFLEEIGAWDEDWEPIGPNPADYIRKNDLRKADWLIAHGTYLSPDDFWQLRPEAAPGDQRVAVVYCPRTHHRFGHAPHPFRAMLDRGVILCLGTDSLASSPSLSVLDEVRFLARRDPSLGGPLLLTMATLFGAWALRAETVTGSLRPGKSADLAAVKLPDREESDPHRLILDSDEPVVATIFEGQLAYGPDRLRPPALTS